MSKEFLHNVFGEKVPERAKYAKPEYSTKNEYGDIIPRYYVGPETDADGFDTNISEGETCYTQEWELPKGMRLCRYSRWLKCSFNHNKGQSRETTIFRKCGRRNPV